MTHKSSLRYANRSQSSTEETQLKLDRPDVSVSAQRYNYPRLPCLLYSQTTTHLDAFVSDISADSAVCVGQHSRSWCLDLLGHCSHLCLCCAVHPPQSTPPATESRKATTVQPEVELARWYVSSRGVFSKQVTIFSWSAFPLPRLPQWRLI